MTVAASTGAGLALRRDGAVLHLAGPLDRAAAPAAWPRLLPLLDGTQVLDLSAVTALDSAGLALLAETVARLSAQGAAPTIEGRPAGLAELCAASRLDAGLRYAGQTA